MITDNVLVYSSGGHGRSLDQDPPFHRSFDRGSLSIGSQSGITPVNLFDYARVHHYSLLNHAVQRRNTKSQRMKLTPQMFVFLIPQSLSQHISSAKSSERLISY